MANLEYIIGLNGRLYLAELQAAKHRAPTVPEIAFKYEKNMYRRSKITTLRSAGSGADGSGADGSGAAGSGAAGSGADGSGAAGSGADGSGADGSGAVSENDELTPERLEALLQDLYK